MNVPSKERIPRPVPGGGWDPPQIIAGYDGRILYLTIVSNSFSPLAGPASEPEEQIINSEWLLSV